VPGGGGHGPRGRWLKALENQGDESLQSLEQLGILNLRTARGWELKTTIEGFWNQPDAVRGKAFFEKWYKRAMRSKMPEFVKLAKSLANSLPRLLNYFTPPITHAMSEGFNNVFQPLKDAARGFRSLGSHGARILFHCAGLAPNTSLKSPGIR